MCLRLDDDADGISALGSEVLEGVVNIGQCIPCANRVGQVQAPVFDELEDLIKVPLCLHHWLVPRERSRFSAYRSQGYAEPLSTLCP